MFPLCVENHSTANIPGAGNIGLLYLKQRSVGPCGRRGKLLPLEIHGTDSRVSKKLGNCWDVQSQFCKEWMKFPLLGRNSVYFPGHSGDDGGGWEGQVPCTGREHKAPWCRNSKLQGAAPGCRTGLCFEMCHLILDRADHFLLCAPQEHCTGIKAGLKCWSPV